MNDEKADKIIELLQQMRDLQLQSVENYKNAIQNQEESIKIQKAAAGKLRKIIFPVLLIVVLLALVAILLVVRLLLRYR
jgi:hypothetical protein